SSHVLFATSFAGLSEPWGNTTATISHINEASVLLIASDLSTCPWLLIKTNDLLVVEQLNLSDDPVSLTLSSCGEPVARLERRQAPLNIHFIDAESVFHFLWLTRQPCGGWKTPFAMNARTLTDMWRHFTIPSEWP
ncbi:hypothetical protein BJ138DRAFT_993031, partial [Hygrophoropsis aurantiaca]